MLPYQRVPWPIVRRHGHFTRYVLARLSAVAVGLSVLPGAWSQEKSPATGEAKLVPGHSTHGEAFNEGPRQSAYVMGTTGNVNFPITTKIPEAQSFFNQGIGQLHGFWYFEAERSFRQVAALDPDAAMAYWGIALANSNNRKRATGVIAEAVKRKDRVSERERLYIEALDAFLKKEDQKKQRATAYTKALENILHKYPDDVEAKALLALQMWLNRDSEIPIVSYLSVDALLDQVFAINPMHPAHHYRIHLWDLEKPEKALASAALCGQSAPGIAHMWHMPGHIYSRVKRYDDACFQQEASARVDHAHMMRDRLLPDQIHNFAHNNEWLIRNLIFVGRVRDAVDLAKNMISLPRHPKWNNMDHTGSYKYGRMRLFQVLETYEMWDEVIALSATPYLEPTEDESEQLKRLKLLGAAYLRKGDVVSGRRVLVEVYDRLRQQQEAREKAGVEAEAKAKENAVDKTKLTEALAAAEKLAKEAGQDDAGIQLAKQKAESKYREEQWKAKAADITKARDDARKAVDSKISALDKAVHALEGYLAVAEQDVKRGLELLKKGGDVDSAYLARVQYRAGEKDEARKAIQRHVDAHPKEVPPLMAQVELMWLDGRKDEARKAFEALREISGSIDALDLPPMARLAPVAQVLGYPADWRVRKPVLGDVGNRPELADLGPFQWQPMPAPSFSLKDIQGREHSLEGLRGRPVVAIFYLGNSCLHCAEQLHKFAEMKREFEEAGFVLLAISTDDTAGLQRAIGSYEGGKFPLTLLANSELDVFKAYRCYDDFEKQPLHGTFLLDGQGKVRWQDISFDPFMEAGFLLKEARRLLAQDQPSGTTPLAGR